MTPEHDRESGLPAIEPSVGFARDVMQRIAEVDRLRAQAAAQSRALGTLWVAAASAAALGALSIGTVVGGPLPGIARLGEVAVTVLAMSDAGNWLPSASIAAGLGLAGAAIAQVVAHRPARAEGRA